jgi:hypothetical protein
MKMPAADSWTITSETGGSDGAKLGDCTIERTATQTTLYAPDGTSLGTVDSVTPPITFDSFSLSDIKFTLTITSFTSGNNDDAIGSWATIDTEGVPEEGNWTAQAGVGEPKPESAAAADAS